MNSAVRKPVILLVIGAVVSFIVAPAIFGIGVFLGVQRGMNAVNDARTVAPNASYETVAGKEISVFRPAGSAGCVLSSPSGPVDLQPDSGDALVIKKNGAQYTLVGRFTPPTATAYTIDCGGPALVLDTRDESRIASGIATPVVISLIAAFLVGMAGFVAFIVGAVLAIRARRG